MDTINSEHEYSKRDRFLILISVCLALFLSPFMGSMINIAAPLIGKSFHMAVDNLPLLSNVYFISSLIVMVPLARLADIKGRRNIFFAGTVVMTISTIAAPYSIQIAQHIVQSMPGYSLSDLSYDILLFWRLIEGFGGAAVAGNGITLLSSVYPQKERGTALGCAVAAVCLGISAGPAFGGIILNTFNSWQSLFYISALLSLITIVIVKFSLSHDIIDCPDEPYDIKGSIIYMILIFLFATGLLSLDQLWGIIPISISILIILPLLIHVEQQTKYPAIAIPLFFKSKAFSISILATTLQFCATSSIGFFLSLYLQYIGLLNPFEAGMLLLITPGIQTILSPIIGSLSDRFESRKLYLYGIIALTVATTLMFLLTKKIDTSIFIVMQIIFGIGYSLAATPNNNMIMDAVDRNDYGFANSIAATMRQMGMVIPMGVATLLCNLNIHYRFDYSAHLPVYQDLLDTIYEAAFIGVIVLLVCILLAFRYKIKK